jgi:hypothetical protein
MQGLKGSYVDESMLSALLNIFKGKYVLIKIVVI